MQVGLEILLSNQRRYVQTLLEDVDRSKVLL